MLLPEYERLQRDHQKLIHANLERIESLLVCAMTQHLGRMPSVEEARLHARRMIFPDGSSEWKWDDITLLKMTAKELIYGTDN